jgi:hypothetical protein
VYGVSLRARGGCTPLVDAGRARAHILLLQSYGVGGPSIAAACDVSPATPQRIRSGALRMIRRSTERRILDVTPEAVADGAPVPIGVTRTLIAELCEEGFTQTQLAHWLGYRGHELSFVRRRRRYVSARTAMRVERLHRELMTDASRRRVAIIGLTVGRGCDD